MISTIKNVKLHPTLICDALESFEIHRIKTYEECKFINGMHDTGILGNFLKYWTDKEKHN